MFVTLNHPLFNGRTRRFLCHDKDKYPTHWLVITIVVKPHLQQLSLTFQPHPTRLAAVRRPLHYRDLCLSSASRIRIASTYDYFVTLLQPQRCSRVSVVCVWVLCALWTALPALMGFVIILNHHQLSSIIINDDQYPFWNQNHHHKPQSSLILNFLIIALETKTGKVVIVTHARVAFICKCSKITFFHHDWSSSMCQTLYMWLRIFRLIFHFLQLQDVSRRAGGLQCFKHISW